MSSARHLPAVFLIATALCAASATAEGVHAGASEPPPQPPNRHVESNTINAIPVVVAAPTDISVGHRESNSQIIVFHERRNVALKSALTVDLTSNALGSSAPFPEREKVSSYYIHFDPIYIGQRGVGTITFPHRILGIITMDASLDASDGVLGLRRTVYPTGEVNRGLGDVLRWIEQMHVLPEI